MENFTFHLLRRYQLPLKFSRYIHNSVFHHSSLIKKPAVVCPNIFCNQVNHRSTHADEKNSILNRLTLKLSNLTYKNAKVTRTGGLIYEKCADDIEYDKLFIYFQLPDTLQSWFLLIQLHVWMCIVRVISEEQGKNSRNGLIESMWCDVDLRLTKLTHMKRSLKKKSLVDMNSQFRAALVSYDEGLFGDDTVLAASVWRTLYSFNCKDPRLLECAVSYIRKQVAHLDSLNTENLIYHGKMSWLPLASTLPVCTSV